MSPAAASIRRRAALPSAWRGVDRRGGQEADDRRDRCGDDRESQRGGDGCERVDTESDAGSHFRGAELGPADIDQAPPTSNDRATSATIGMRDDDDDGCADDADEPSLVAATRSTRCCRTVEFDRGPSLSPRRSSTITMANSTSCNTDSAAAPPTSPSCVARRAISTSSVGLRRPSEQLGDTERREAEQEDHHRRRPQRRPQQRQHDEPRRSDRRRAERAGRTDEVVRDHRDHRSHQSDDDGDVEEDVRDDHGLWSAVPRRGKQSDERGADDNRRQHERHRWPPSTAADLESCSEPARTPAASRRSSVSTVLTVACHAVNHTIPPT